MEQNSSSDLYLDELSVWRVIRLDGQWNYQKLTGFLARNCGTIQLVLISKFAFAPGKLPGLSRNGTHVGPISNFQINI